MYIMWNYLFQWYSQTLNVTVAMSCCRFSRNCQEYLIDFLQFRFKWIPFGLLKFHFEFVKLICHHLPHFAKYGNVDKWTKYQIHSFHIIIQKVRYARIVCRLLKSIWNTVKQEIQIIWNLENTQLNCFETPKDCSKSMKLTIKTNWVSCTHKPY